MHKELCVCVCVCMWGGGGGGGGVVQDKWGEPDVSGSSVISTP